MSEQKLPRSSQLIALLCGVLGTVQYHSAQFLSGFDTFFGDRGDARGVVYFCEHWYQSLIGKASLLSPAIFYPTKGTLAYSDLLVGMALPYSVLRVLGFGMFSAAEVVIILTTFLSYCAAFWLLNKTLGFRLAPSIIGAMFFAFSGPKFFQTIHLQLQFVVLLPAIFALVITFAKQARTMTERHAAVLLALIAVCFVVLLATTFYYAWFLVLWSLLFLVVALAITPAREFIVSTFKSFWRPLVIAAGVFVVGFIPVLVIYLPALRLGTWYRYDFVSQMIPDWRSLFAMGDGNYLWSRMPALLWGNARPDVWGEIQIGIGMLPSLAWIFLTVASVWWVVRRRGEVAKEPRRFGEVFLVVMILATTLFYLIGFKYAGHSPWSFIYRFFPGAGAIRAVARYVIFLTLPISIALAYALNKGLDYAARVPSAQRRRALTIAMLAVAAFGVVEQFGVHKISGTGFSITVENAYLKAMAAKVQRDCGAFYVKVGPHANHSIAEYHYDAMLISLISRIPTFNASSSQFPRDWNMYFIKNPDYEDHVREWINSQHVGQTVCPLEIGPEVEAFDLHYPTPIDNPEFFVRQLYRDFANQEPEEEIKAQVAKLTNCRTGDDSCSREQIALNVFLSTGFHERGFFILRMYEAGLNRLPAFDEFAEAMHAYRDELSLQSPEVAKELMESWLVGQRIHSGLIDEKALRERTDSDDLINRLRNRSFVALHYYGFLRRAPDGPGLENWVERMDRSGDPVKITKGVIDSVEYRQRFRN